MTSRFSYSSQTGFTLLEVMVAFSIFALIGLSAHQFLRTIITTREVTQETNATISGASRAFTMMQRDFTHLANRQIRDAYGESLPPLMVSTGEYPVELSRSGWNNPARLPRSNMQRVAYDLNEDGELQRHFWLVMDRAQDSEPITQVLLADVEDFRINLMNNEGGFVDAWPDFDSNDRLPRAVEILVTHKKLGELRKIYSVVTAADSTVVQSNINGGNTGDPKDAETDNASGSRSTRGNSNVQR